MIEANAPMWTTIIALSFHITPTANQRKIPTTKKPTLIGYKPKPVRPYPISWINVATHLTISTVLIFFNN